jgi:DNA-binding XRE family transcriptional regulator
MQSQAASSKPTKTLESLSTRFVDQAPQTSTIKARVIFAEFAAPSKLLPVPGAIDIDVLVAELESQSPENAKALARGRKWVADTFYADRPSIARFRLKHGWSQAELAKRAETSQSYIARLEQGKIDPQMSTVRKIAAALGVPIQIFAQALVAEAAA